MSSNDWDVIVIGSGIGGLTTAGLLAGVAGKRVLVLEKHSEPGGLTHVFRRDGATWDVGLHYVGQMQAGTRDRALFDYLSGGQLAWNKMSDAFERFVYPEFTFTAPSDAGRYQADLIKLFPDEARAIERYFKDVRAVQRWNTLGFARAMVPRPIEPLLRLTQRLTRRKALQTTKNYLDRHFRSPRLRALLASQWGDYGLPPSRSAFAIHAQIVTHYLDGAWFPEGGAARIARTFEPGIESRGGAIRVCQEVTAILVRDGRAVGVKVVDRRGPELREMTLLAPVVISDAGAPITYKTLLPTDGAVGAKTAPVRALIDSLQGGLSAVTLYLRLSAPASTIGVRGENYWINTSFDHDGMVQDMRSLLNGAPQHVYVSFPSAKSGETTAHTAEVISFIDHQGFAAWRDEPKGARGADYTELKHRIGEGMLRLAETAVPGLTSLVAYSELSTPLSVEYYTSHPDGHFYGLAATPERYRSDLLGPRTAIEGLYLTGSDAGCLGIVGALMGGVGAASQALGPKGYPQIQAALRAGPRRQPALSLPPEKRRATLAAKTQLTPTIWRLDFDLSTPIGDFAPGQYGRLKVADFEWRDYSIADVEGARVGFLISTRTGGCGSRYVINAQPGSETVIELPLGHYGLARNERRKVFIATGTGLAPFLPMFRRLRAEGALGDAELFFGCRTAAEDITAHLDPLPGTVIRCLSREAPQPGGFEGRVSQAIVEQTFDPARTEFYLCGSAAMVVDCRDELERRGARYIHIESY